MSEYILEIKGITKKYPGVTALNGVDLKLKPGTIHALMGENGAGKSTLMRIIAGEEKQSKGTMILKGKEVCFNGPEEALESGIGMVHQELIPILEMSITENLFMGNELYSFGNFIINHKKMNEMAVEMMKEVGLEINPNTLMKNLTTAQMQLVEIAKVLHHNADIIIMDEPTTAITDTETQLLFEILRKLKRENKGIIYISHRMEEIYQIADEISIFRDGEYEGTFDTKDLPRDQLVHKMVNREFTEIFPEHEQNYGKELLRVENLCSGRNCNNISFRLREGEILGFTGLMGAGRTETVEAIFGMSTIDSGKIYCEGKEVKIKNCKDAIRQGIGLITDDRKYKGLVTMLSVEDNIALPNLEQNIRFGMFTQSKKIANICAEYTQKLNIKASGPKQKVDNLSGGNQQKVVLAKWIARSPKILIFDEPTKGIDIGAKVEFYNLIVELANQGIGVIVISSEMEEIMGMSDSIIVFKEGVITGKLSKEEMDQKTIMGLAI